MSKRFQTYFGVPIPPFKKQKLGAGSTTIRFVLTGKIISKKNNNNAIAIRQPIHKWANEQAKNRPATWADVHRAINMVKAKMVGNLEYKKFLIKMKPIIQEQMNEWRSRLGDKGLVFPLDKSTISTRLYIKDRYRRDTANAIQTIQDLLVACNVIVDDDDAHLNPIYGESERYYEEIIYNIAFISISFKL